MDFRISRFFFRISRPLYLLSGVLVYALGVGIADYLGTFIDWPLVLLGQTWVTIFQLGAHFLIAYFHLPGNPRDPGRILIPSEGEEPQGSFRRDLILWAGLAAFVANTSITLVLIRSRVANVPVLAVVGLLYLVAVLYAVPPFSLVTSGYGEIIMSILMANLIPALGFMLQYRELHRLVTMSTFPLTMLHLAMLIAIQFPDYLPDLKQDRGTLLVRLGWERGMLLHNLLILIAFVLLGMAMFFGLPSTVALPPFLVLPLGLFQIWYMTRIAAGAKPNWRALNLTAILTFGLTAYLLTFTFWTR